MYILASLVFSYVFLCKKLLNLIEALFKINFQLHTAAFQKFGILIQFSSCLYLFHDSTITFQRKLRNLEVTWNCVIQYLNRCNNRKCIYYSYLRYDSNWFYMCNNKGNSANLISLKSIVSTVVWFKYHLKFTYISCSNAIKSQSFLLRSSKHLRTP